MPRVLNCIHHSFSLGTDPPLTRKPKPSNFFCPPGTEKLSPSRLTKRPDNSNMLNMFNNNTCTVFRTAYKHVVIPSCVIRVI